MKEDIQFLKELQQELLTQEHDGQAAPRYWALMDYKWMVTEEGYHDRVSIVFLEDGEPIILDDYIEEILNGESEKEFSNERIEELKDIYEIGSENEILNWIEENDNDDCYLVYEKEEEFIVPNTMFLTKDDAKQHIKLNHYHYTNKVHTYAMTAWRSPKVERLINILENFDWDKIELKSV